MKFNEKITRKNAPNPLVSLHKEKKMWITFAAKIVQKAT